MNEQFGIEKTIKSIQKSTKSNVARYDLEIIVVDGESTDATCQIATRLGAKVIVERRKGYGRACKSGFEAARGKIIVTLDADNTYPTERIPIYIEMLVNRGLDFLSINRFSCMDKGAMNLRRRFGNKLLTFVMNILYHIDIKDSQSGMWIMKKSFVSHIKLLSDDMSLSEEIKIIAFRFFKAAEVDGKYSARSGTAKLKDFRDGWKNLIYLLSYRKRFRSAILDPSSSSSSPKEKEILS